MFNRNFTVYKYFDFQDALLSQKGETKKCRVGDIG